MSRLGMLTGDFYIQHFSALIFTNPNYFHCHFKGWHVTATLKSYWEHLLMCCQNPWPACRRMSNTIVHHWPQAFNPLIRNACLIRTPSCSAETSGIWFEHKIQAWYKNQRLKSLEFGWSIIYLGRLDISIATSNVRLQWASPIVCCTHFTETPVPVADLCRFSSPQEKPVN